MSKCTCHERDSTQRCSSCLDDIRAIKQSELEELVDAVLFAARGASLDVEEERLLVRRALVGKLRVEYGEELGLL